MNAQTKLELTENLEDYLFDIFEILKKSTCRKNKRYCKKNEE